LSKEVGRDTVSGSGRQEGKGSGGGEALQGFKIGDKQKAGRDIIRKNGGLFSTFT